MNILKKNLLSLFLFFVTLPILSNINPPDSIKQKLVQEVKSYIMDKFPKTHQSIPISIVNHGLNHNIDIIFMMAQTQIETQFGNSGIGKPTSKKSLFGVMSRRYNTYDHAIEDYISILKRNYLQNGKTTRHLMNNYITNNGKRYAANMNYEKELKKTYQNIHNSTKITTLQKKFYKYK